ncbi:MAG TPA: hypothetical protein VM491_15120, partial [Burkholderiaceae bacterium]|nr:hypothetical protein [Burkholderiaceae bacterium]
MDSDSVFDTGSGAHQPQLRAGLGGAAVDPVGGNRIEGEHAVMVRNHCGYSAIRAQRDCLVQEQISRDAAGEQLGGAAIHRQQRHVGTMPPDPVGQAAERDGVARMQDPDAGDFDQIAEE